jgi:hypothetical protein
MAGKNVEINAVERKTVSKDWLLKFVPNSNVDLTDTEKRILSHWLALRYERPAFPDELVRRLNRGKASDIFAAACKKSGEAIQGIYIAYDPKYELPGDERELYSINVRVVWNSEVEHGEEIAQVIVGKIRDKFVSVFHKQGGSRQDWFGIELGFCEAVSDLDFTLRDIRTHEAWKNDEISLADDSDLPMRA